MARNKRELPRIKADEYFPDITTALPDEPLSFAEVIGRVHGATKDGKHLHVDTDFGF